MGQNPNVTSELRDIVVVFGAALLGGWLLRLARAPAIIGFLCAGIAIGPSGLDWIDAPRVHFFAEIGLALLLFSVGLELSPEPLARSGVRLVLTAALQMSAICLVVALIAMLAFGIGAVPAIVIGVAVSLSSTAIVLKQLSDRGETDTPTGVLTTGILIVQDVAVIVLLAFLPVAAGAAGGGVGDALRQTLLSLGGLVLAVAGAKLLLPLVARQVLQRGGTELMTLLSLVTACVGAWLADLAGWSWALGSCIAGLLLAQTELRYQLRAEITPFRDSLNALFFASIGMLVNVQSAYQQALPLALAIVGTLIGKALLTSLAAGSAGWPVRLALTAGLGLATISEFSYVLADEAASVGLLSRETLSFIVAWTVGTMLLGAMLVPAARPLADRLAAIVQRDRRRTPPAPTEAESPGAARVVIVGYGVNGRNLARTLRATRIPFVVIELNRRTAQQARGDGAAVVLGDATRLVILEEAGVQSARAVVVVIADVEATRRVVARVRTIRPDVFLLARTRYVAELDALRRLGADLVIPEEFETSIEIFSHVLKELGIPDNVIEQQIALVRAGGYGMLRGRAADRGITAEWVRAMEATVTQTHLLLDASPARGKTLRELDLRAQTGVTIAAITRRGTPIPNPSPDLPLEAGDVLVLVGAHGQLLAARAELDPPASPGVSDL
ncbi:Glutathione-regulated potassium-efflux system protein KefC [Phycisphaerae bacterium RAS1]|nr:Glutathione-regulated potassium-efflux system protein KefC [Phycisphaerae bacterium RAS1]